MFNSSATNDDELENARIIVNIFSYLTSKELRNARVLNFAFNKLVTSHPKLFWAKNVFRIHIPSCENDNDERLKTEWAQLRLHNLITNYNCPNYHFIKTNLLDPGAVEFFQSSIRYQIKYLKLTKCRLKYETLLHILTCIGRKLEHLEIEDFSKFETINSLSEDAFPESHSNLCLHFPCLLTLVLRGKRRGSSNRHFSEIALPYDFFHIILNGSYKLQTICILEWKAITCQRFARCLASIDSGKLQNVHSLEITCSNETLEAHQQYEMLNFLEWVYLPSLKKLSIIYDKESLLNTFMEGDTSVMTIKSDFVASITNSIATLIEASSTTLESIELVNCPVSNNVFRAGIHSFKNLRHVNTKGSFVTKLDDDASPFFEYAPMMNQNHQRRAAFQDESANPESNVSITFRNSGNLTRVEIYKLAAAVFVTVALIHIIIMWTFGSSFGRNLEIVIYAIIAAWTTQRNKIADIWALAFSK